MNLRAALAILLALSGVASSAEPDRARIHFDRGSALYEAGDYRGALREFEEANRIFPRREFLVNLGQAHRLLNEFAEARALYARYLATAQPGDPYLGEVRDILSELDRRLAHAPAVERPAKAVHEVAAAPRPPSRRRTWWLIGAAAAVVLAALAIGLGVGLTASAGGGGCDPGVVSCIDLRR